MGISEGVNYASLTKEGIVNGLMKLLENPSYALNAVKWSARFRDQKEKPLQRAVWWAEWLLRHPDCDYLKSPVLRLGFIVGNAYDVIAFILLVIVAFLVIFVKCIRACLCSKKSSVIQSDIKNKKQN